MKPLDFTVNDILDIITKFAERDIKANFENYCLHTNF